MPILASPEFLSENSVEPGACLLVPGSPGILTGLVEEPGASSQSRNVYAGSTRNLALLFLAGPTNFISYKIPLEIKYSSNVLLSASHPSW